MIIYVVGDIFESKDVCIVNPVNTVGVMGGGLALDFKRKYPEMYEVYKKHCAENKLTVSTLMFYKPKNQERIICNFPTKIHWKNPSKLSYVESGLIAFVNYYKDFNITSASFPKLGCGLGGLNWELEVRPIMEHHLNKIDIPIHIYV